MPDFKAEFNKEPRVGVLVPGDILLKRNLDGFKSDALGNTISFMQMLNPSHGDNLPGAYLSGHAAIFIEGDQVAEAIGDGVSLTSLNGNIKHTRYIVFRCTNPQAAANAAKYAKLLTERHRGVNEDFVDGKYAPWKAARSLTTTRHMGKNGKRLMDHVNQYVSGQKVVVPNFFCSMFVYTVFEVALEANERFGYDPYSVDPKFYHKILDTSQLFEKKGKYIHVISNEIMRQECFYIVKEAIANYERIRGQQHFLKSFRKVSDQTANALKILKECVKFCEDNTPDTVFYDVLIAASLYYTGSESEIEKLVKEFWDGYKINSNSLRSMYGSRLQEGSTFLKELDKTSFFKRLRSVRKA
jgi:hypothetical protein